MPLTRGNTLYSMDTLPPEVISEIFVSALSGFSIHSCLRLVDLVTQVNDRNAALARLLTVSCHWRDIAYGNPTLWSLVYIPRSSRDGAHLSRSLVQADKGPQRMPGVLLSQGSDSSQTWRSMLLLSGCWTEASCKGSDAVGPRTMILVACHSPQPFVTGSLDQID